jgi:hypothetical protein
METWALYSELPVSDPATKKKDAMRLFRLRVHRLSVHSVQGGLPRVKLALDELESFVNEAEYMLALKLQ